ncbi:MAG: hypothetical protein GY852_09035, partial [bacterium]|nr:hypothetical protein [bacterium]
KIEKPKQKQDDQKGQKVPVIEKKQPTSDKKDITKTETKAASARIPVEETSKQENSRVLAPQRSARIGIPGEAPLMDEEGEDYFDDRAEQSVQDCEDQDNLDDETPESSGRFSVIGTHFYSGELNTEESQESSPRFAPDAGQRNNQNILTPQIPALPPQPVSLPTAPVFVPQSILPQIPQMFLGAVGEFFGGSVAYAQEIPQMNQEEQRNLDGRMEQSIEEREGQDSFGSETEQPTQYQDNQEDHGGFDSEEQPIQNGETLGFLGSSSTGAKIIVTTSPVVSTGAASQVTAPQALSVATMGTYGFAGSGEAQSAKPSAQPATTVAPGATADQISQQLDKDVPVRGLTYSPIRIGGDRKDGIIWDAHLGDIPLMKKMGVNTIRTYYP